MSEGPSRLQRRNSEDLLWLAQQAGRLGFFEWNVDEGSVYLSPLCLSLLGLKDFDGRHESWLKCIHREDQVRVATLIEDTFAGKQPEWQAEFRVRSGGDVRWVEMRNIVSYGEDGQPARVVGVAVDVTERKRAAVQLHARADTLE